MSTTIPTEFTGEPTLTLEKIEAITGWYHETLGDSDKASSIEESVAYSAEADAFESVLRLLYDMPMNDDPIDCTPGGC